MPIIPTLERPRQEDHKFSLDHTVRPCLKTTKHSILTFSLSKQEPGGKAYNLAFWPMFNVASLTQFKYI